MNKFINYIRKQLVSELPDVLNTSNVLMKYTPKDAKYPCVVLYYDEEPTDPGLGIRRLILYFCVYDKDDKFPRQVSERITDLFRDKSFAGSDFLLHKMFHMGGIMTPEYDNEANAWRSTTTFDVRVRLL